MPCTNGMYLQYLVRGEVFFCFLCVLHFNVLYLLQELDFCDLQSVQEVYRGNYNHYRCFLNIGCYWIFSLLLMTWPYRLFHMATIRRTKYTFLKIVKLGQLDRESIINDLFGANSALAGILHL